MLTAKGKYGLKALVYLAALKQGSSAHVVDIAKRTNISKKFLDTILLELRNAGIVQSKRGPGGGYRLAHPPRAIKAGFVIRTLDGPLAPIACASRTAYKPCRDCRSVQNCEVRRTMTLVRDATANILDKLSIADMIRRKRPGI
jgi:Rrf2 family protein